MELRFVSVKETQDKKHVSRKANEDSQDPYTRRKGTSMLGSNSLQVFRKLIKFSLIYSVSPLPCLRPCPSLSLLHGYLDTCQEVYEKRGVRSLVIESEGRMNVFAFSSHSA